MHSSLLELYWYAKTIVENAILSKYEKYVNKTNMDLIAILLQKDFKCMEASNLSVENCLLTNTVFETNLLSAESPGNQNCIVLFSIN